MESGGEGGEEGEGEGEEAGEEGAHEALAAMMSSQVRASSQLRGRTTQCRGQHQQEDSSRHVQCLAACIPTTGPPAPLLSSHQADLTSSSSSSFTFSLPSLQRPPSARLAAKRRPGQRDSDYDDDDDDVRERPARKKAKAKAAAASRAAAAVAAAAAGGAAQNGIGAAGAAAAAAAMQVGEEGAGQRTYTFSSGSTAKLATAGSHACPAAFPPAETFTKLLCAPACLPAGDSSPGHGGRRQLHAASRDVCCRPVGEWGLAAAAAAVAVEPVVSAIFRASRDHAGVLGAGHRHRAACAWFSTHRRHYFVPFPTAGAAADDAVSGGRRRCPAGSSHGELHC